MLILTSRYELIQKLLLIAVGSCVSHSAGSLIKTKKVEPDEDRPILSLVLWNESQE